MQHLHFGINASDLRRIISQKPDRGVLEFNNSGVVEFASPEFLGLIRQRQKDVVGRPLHSFIPQEDFQPNIEKLINGHIPLARFVSPWDDGNQKPIFLSFKCYPPFDDAQKIVSAVKKASWSLHQGDNVPPQVYIDYALQQMPGALWHYSLKAQQFEYLSPAIESIFETPLETFVSNLFLGVHPEDTHNLDSFLRSFEGSPRYIGFRYQGANGHWKLISGYKYIVTDKEGRKTSVAGIFLDRSSIAQRNLQLEGALHTFENLVQERLTHSLKTIQAHHEILDHHCRNIIDREGYEIIESLGVSIHRMSGLLEGLSQSLHLISQDKPREDVQLNLLLREHLIPDYKFKDASFELEVGNLPSVNGNQEDLIILFKNVIDNGIQHNHNEPRIHIKGKQTQKGILITIQDNGIGIPKEAHTQVFEPGRRLEMSMPSPNNGMGLTLSKIIAEKYGGRIWIHSKMGVGTIVYIFFPINESK